MIEVCLPGTGGMMPTEHRWLSCCWIELQGKAILIDCGEGTQIALKKSRCKISHLDLILLTHFHADHIAGLLGLLLTLGNYGKKDPLKIMGPKGLAKVMDAILVMAPVLPYPLIVEELESSIEAEFSYDGIEFSTLPLKHGIPCLGYCMTVKRKSIFNPLKAEALGVPKTLYKVLHEGKPVQLADGRIIEPQFVLDGERAPIKICYMTDTAKVESMSQFAFGADLLISEGMYAEDEKHEKMTEKGHMLFSDSGELAQEASVKELWLTHFSPALTKPEQFIDRAQQPFFQTIIAFDGIRKSF